MSRSSILRILLPFLICGVIPATVFAQANSLYLPKMRYEPVIPRDHETPSTFAGNVPVVGEQDQQATVIIEELRGILILDSSKKLKLIAPSVEGVEFDCDRPRALAHTPEFQKILYKYIGKPFKVADITSLQKELNDLYQKYDIPVVGLVVPNQDVDSGSIQVVLYEGYVNSVRITGNKYFSTPWMCSQVITRPGTRIHESLLNEDARWLSRNPFRDVSASLEPTDREEFFDVIYKVEEDYPIRAFAGYADNGTRSTGIDRVVMGLTYTTPQDRLLNYTYSATPNFENVQVHSGSYLLPLKNKDFISLYGYHGTMQPNMGNTLFNNEGVVWQTSLRYSKLLGITPKKDSRREQRFNIGYDFKETNSDLDFGGFLVSSSEAQISQFVFGYNDVYVNKNGFISFDANLYWSPGKMSPKNNDEHFADLRWNSKSEYVYATADITATRFLSEGLQWNSRLSGQWSSTNLISIESFCLGGDGNVRGYDTFALSPDSGWVFSNELATRYKKFGLSKALRSSGLYSKVRTIDDEIQFYGFFDVGGGWNHTKYPIYDSQYDSIAGTGVGLRYNFGPWVRLSAAYGFRLNDLYDDGAFQGRPHVSIVISR